MNEKPLVKSVVRVGTNRACSEVLRRILVYFVWFGLNRIYRCLES